MEQPLARDARGMPGHGKEQKETVRSGITTAIAYSLARQRVGLKHGLHGLCAGQRANGADSGHAGDRELKSSPLQQALAMLPPAPVDHNSSVSLDIDRELRSLAKHYRVEACVVALAEGNGKNIRVLAKHGSDFNSEQRGPDDSSFEFFRHHIARDLPIIIPDATKKRGLEKHPLVARGPGIVFYAAAPIILGPSTYAGTVSIFDSKPRHGFTLQDCEVLQAVAGRVAEVAAQTR